jgi:hypothetical protein
MKLFKIFLRVFCTVIIRRTETFCSPCTTLIHWFCIPEVESVYSAVRPESLYKTDTLRLQRVNVVSSYHNFAAGPSFCYHFKACQSSPPFLGHFCRKFVTILSLVNYSFKKVLDFAF